MQWGTAGQMVGAWVLTIPAAGAVAAGAFAVSDAIGSGEGALAVGLAGAAAGATLFFVTSRRDPVTPDTV